MSGYQWKFASCISFVAPRVDDPEPAEDDGGEDAAGHHHHGEDEADDVHVALAVVRTLGLGEANLKHSVSTANISQYKVQRRSYKF